MERLILKNLIKWKNSKHRKPLILKGVRQVGKTWILKEFGRRYYDNTAYFNFDENEEYKAFFETTKDVERILQNLVQYLESVKTIEPIPEAFFNPLYEKLKMYYVTGGMPEPVAMWTEDRDVDAMQQALSNIIGAYERDFGKHPDLKEFPKISMIWKSIPSQLAPTAFGEGNRLFTEFKGALSENYVLEAFKNQFEVTPRYWSQVNPSSEVDFIIRRENDIIPVEVKAEDNTEAKSLKKYKEKFGDKVKLRVRCSLDNLKLDGDLLNIPLFMADYADTLIGIALTSLQRAE